MKICISFSYFEGTLVCIKSDVDLMDPFPSFVLLKKLCLGLFHLFGKRVAILMSFQLMSFPFLTLM